MKTACWPQCIKTRLIKTSDLTSARFSVALTALFWNKCSFWRKWREKSWHNRKTLAICTKSTRKPLCWFLYLFVRQNKPLIAFFLQSVPWLDIWLHFLKISTVLPLKSGGSNKGSRSFEPQTRNWTKRCSNALSYLFSNHIYCTIIEITDSSSKLKGTILWFQVRRSIRCLVEENNDGNQSFTEGI